MKLRLTAAWTLPVVALVVLEQHVAAHVTIRATGPLAPSGSATVTLTCPSERPIDTTKIVLEVSDEFLQSGGRLSRLQFPPGWKVRIEKEDMPADVYAKESAARSARDAKRQPAAQEHAPAGESAQAEKDAQAKARKQWIKRVIFEEGKVPPDGFVEIRLSLQLPSKPGRYRFAATQTYADGKDVAWTQLVDGAEHPAPEIVVETPATRWNGWQIATVLALILAFAAFFRKRAA